MKSCVAPAVATAVHSVHRTPAECKKETMIYFNNAATTWPKPEIVYESVDECFRNLNSPDRTTSEEGIRSAATMQNCRAEIAEFFGVTDPSRLVFEPSCTYALNLAILGLDWHEGDVALMSGLEHHAVSRPLRKVARERNACFEVIPYTPDQPVDLDFIADHLRTGKVKLVACTMASNVTGHIMPVHEIGSLCREYDALFLVDAAQSAGVLPVDVEALQCDFLAFAGHKGLFSPPGVGGLFVREGLFLNTLAEGGTGKDSGEHSMSGSFPSTFEVGTHNLMAIVGATAGVRWLNQAGIDKIHLHEHQLAKRFIEGIQQLPDVTIYGPSDMAQRTAVVSLTFAGVAPENVSHYLAEKHNISTRSGYHCAPLAHETIGTLPGDGTTRFSFGFANTVEEVDTSLSVLAEMCAEVRA
jgi:cysteine desulfurase family protein